MPENVNIGEYILGWLLPFGLSSEESLLGTVLLYVCTIALTGCVGAASYQGAKAAIKVASTGKMNGNVGYVVRACFAISMLAPIWGGVSSAHIVIKNIAETAVSAADIAAIEVVSFLESEGGTIIPPAQLYDASNIALHILEAETCHRAAEINLLHDQQRGILSEDDGAIFQIVKKSDAVSLEWGIDTNKKYGDSNIACGAIAISVPNNIDEKWEIDPVSGRVGIQSHDYKTKEETILTNASLEILNSQIAAALNLKNKIKSVSKEVTRDLVLLPVATELRYDSSATTSEVEALYQTIQDIEFDIEANIPSMINRLTSSYESYKLAVNQAGTKAAKSVVKDNLFEPEVREKGFIWLGTYFNQAQEDSSKNFELRRHLVKPSNLSGLVSNTENNKLPRTIFSIRSDASYKLIIERLSQLQTGLIKSIPPGQRFVTPNGIAILNSDLEEDVSLISFIKDFKKNVLDYFKTLFIGNQNGGDFISRAAEFGGYILKYLEPLLLVLIGVGAIAKVAPVTGLAANFATSMATKIAGGAIEGIITMLTLLLIIGIVMGVILPFLPMINWIIAVTNWALSLLIAYFFIPFWLMQHCFGGAEDDFLLNQESKTGYWVAGEALIRPILMVAAFACMLIGLNLISITMELAAQTALNVIADGNYRLISLIVVLLIMTFLAYRLVMRIFTLVSELPDFVIQKLSGSSSSMGEIAESRETQSTIIGGVVPAKGMAKSAGKAITPQAPIKTTL